VRRAEKRKNSLFFLLTRFRVLFHAFQRKHCEAAASEA